MPRAVYCSPRSTGCGDGGAAASQVHGLLAKMGCKSEQRKKELEKRLFCRSDHWKGMLTMLILQISSPKPVRAHTAPEGSGPRSEIQGACQ